MNLINPFALPLDYGVLPIPYNMVSSVIGFGMAIGSSIAGIPFASYIYHIISHNGSVNVINNLGKALVPNVAVCTMIEYGIGKFVNAIFDCKNFGTKFLYALNPCNESLTEIEIPMVFSTIGSLVAIAIATGGLIVGVPLLAPTISNAITYLGLSPITSYFGRAAVSTAACTIVGNTIGKAVDVSYSCTSPYFTLKDQWRFRAYTLKDVKIVDIPPRS